MQVIYIQQQQSEAEQQRELRFQDALTDLARIYHQCLLKSPDVLNWIKTKYQISEEMIASLQIGYAE